MEIIPSSIIQVSFPILFQTAEEKEKKSLLAHSLRCSGSQPGVPSTFGAVAAWYLIARSIVREETAHSMVARRKRETGGGKFPQSPSREHLEPNFLQSDPTS